MTDYESEWTDVVPKLRGVEGLTGDRFQVVLRPNRKIMYISEKITAGLAVPVYIGLKIKKGTSLVGLFIATKSTGYKVKYEASKNKSKVGSLTIKSFADAHPEWLAGSFECIRQTIKKDGGGDSIQMFVFDMIPPKSQQKPKEDIIVNTSVRSMAEEMA